MKILAFDSSAKSASVCILEEDKILGEMFQNIGQTHSKTLLPMAEKLLESLNMTLEDIDKFAVNHGPGSFTGIRIGVSIVQALALGQDKPCVGISTLKSMAYGLKEITQDTIVCLMDARANQVYNAIFQNIDGEFIQIAQDRAISIDDLSVELKNMKKSYIFVGDGAEICYNMLESSGLEIKLAPEHLRYQRASFVAKASLEYDWYDSLNLIPTYLRLPQAKREQKTEDKTK